MVDLNRIGIGTGAAKNLTVDLLHAAYDMGMNVVDTSPRCGSEKIVGESLKGRRDKVYVITKVSPEHMRADDLVSSCERSLKIMGTDYIDLLTTHWPNPAIPMEETVAGLMKLRDQGKVREVGVGNVSLRELISYRYLMPEIKSIQNEYNLFECSVEDEILPYCKEKNLKFFAYSPLDGGNFCGRHAAAEMVKNCVTVNGKTKASICLGYLLSNKSVYVLPRISNISRLKEIAKVKPLLKRQVKSIRFLLESFRGMNGPLSILPSEIDLQLSPYKTIDDATHNYLGYKPEPLDMAKGELYLKPLKVRREDTTYILVEGFMRYWAHVIALGNDPVDVLVRE